MDELLEALGAVSTIKGVDLPLIVALVASGFLIKHSLKKVPNYLIPAVQLVISAIVNFVTIPSFSGTNIAAELLDSVMSAAIAVGIHQYGKKSITYIKAIVALFSKTNTIDTTDDNKK